MTRRLRINCPACQAVLEIAGSAEPQVELACPKCGKRIIAKVTEAARPKPAMASSPRNGPAPSPASSPLSSPASAQGDLWSSPLVPQAPFPVASQGGYYASPARSKINHKAWIWPVAIALGLLVAIPIVWYGSGAVASLADSDWSSFSLVPDSHERLVDDFFSQSEENILRTLAADFNDANYRTDLIAYVKSNARRDERLLLRAVKLTKVPLSEKANFDDRGKALMEKYRAQSEEKAKTVPQDAFGLRGADIEQDAELRDAVSISSAAGAYISKGIWDLPAPENDTEQIYYDEADIVREFLKSLASIHSKRQAKKAPAAIEAYADRMLELAVRRSTMPSNFLERVPREYVDIDRTFGFAQKALIRRLEREYEPGEELKDAIANFSFARECLSRAANGTSQSMLEKSFADAREAHAKTLSRPDKELGNKPVRDMVIKPPAPVNTSEEKSSMTAPWPSAAQSAETRPALAVQESKPAPAQPQPDMVADGEATLAPDPHDVWNVNPPIGFPRVPRPLRPPTGSARPDPPWGGAPRGEFAGPRGGPAPSHEMPSLETQVERFSGPGAVLINVINMNVDMKAAVQPLCEKLSVKEHFWNSSNGKAVIGLRFSGPVEEVANLIDFGKVTSVDSGKRVIVVDGKSN